MNRSFHRALPGLALVALLILLAACAAPVAPAIDEGAPAARLPQPAPKSV